MKSNLIILFLIITIALVLEMSCKKRDFVKVAMVKSNSVYLENDTATLGSGVIIDLGTGSIKQYGFCISSTPNPTISNQKTDYGSPSGTGDFSGYINITRWDSINYVRAYMYDSLTAVYGAEMIFYADRQLLIPNRNWTMTGYSVYPAFNGVTNYYDTFPNYVKDDYAYFFNSGIFANYEGKTKQNDSSPDINSQGTWSLNSDKTKITIVETANGATSTTTYNIISVTKDRLVLTNTKVSNGTSYLWTNIFERL